VFVVRVWRNSEGQVSVTPSETDFETQVLASGVNVFFKPTQSHYIFVRISDVGHVSRSAPLSRDAIVRHDGSGDTADYEPTQLFEMAYRVASKAASDGRVSS
jgi:hypothetical protein